MMTENSSLNVSETAFLSNEKASQLILNNIHDAFLLLDKQLNIVYLNKAAAEGSQLYLNQVLCTGMNIMEFVQESRRPLLATVYDSVLQGKKHLTETPIQLPDGTFVCFENSFYPAYNDDEIIGIVVCSKDITERKKTEHAIQESEERLQFALEAANQGAWDWNLLTNEVTYSSSYKKLYGFEENELKNHVSEWMTRIHPDDQKKMGESVTQHLNAEDTVYDSQYRIKGKDGRYRWVMAKGRLVSFDEKGRPLRMIGTHTDITEAVEKEEKLKQINERFDSMMQATNELLWEWDIVQNQIYRAEDGMRKVYGIAFDSSIREIEQWMQRIHPEDHQKVCAMLADILKASHQQTFELEYRFKRDDGEYAHIYDRGILLKDENNKPLRIIGAAQDISERKRLEKNLLEAELEYQKLIHQATVDSQENERTEIGKELHDNVNQVLTTTKLYLDLALTNGELKEELIRKSLKNITDVIQEIRHLSRSLMDPSIGDLGLIDSIKDLIENIHLTQKLIVYFTAVETIETFLDRNHKLALFRIIQESLNNVLRHAKATTVNINITIQKDQLLLTIKDNGIGFFPAVTKKGAGLKNIQNRVYLINGTLQIESEPEKGCTVYIQFPIKITS